MKKITVVSVVYNAEKDIESTFRSIFSQTSFEDIEYIIIDGNSTDTTKDIIEKYREKIDFYISEKDEGVYSAMNKAIDIASCEWINFMNAGDSFYEEKTLERVIRQLDGNFDLAYGDVHIFDDGTIDRLVKAELDNKVLKETPFCHQSLFVKTELMRTKKFNLFYKVLADFNFILDCYLSRYKFQYLDFPISRYQLGGMSQKNIDLMHIEGVKILMDARQKNSDITLEDSPFYKGLRNSVGDAQSQRIKESVGDLATTSFIRKPIDKFKRYKALMQTYLGHENLNQNGVVHINTFDNVGGASRAVFRLDEALGKFKFHSTIHVLYKTTNSNKVSKHNYSNYVQQVIKVVNRLPLIRYGMKELLADNPFSTNLMGMDVSTFHSVSDARVIHLHWINYGYISFKSLERMVAMEKPLVWTLHDMWPMTGGCHNSIDCRQFEQECGSCPLLGSDNPKDISHYIHSKKSSILKSANLTVVAPSRWMKEQANKSSLFLGKEVVVIPNPINTQFFKKVSMNVIRGYFPFADTSKRYIVFGTHSNAAYKGLRYLLDALDSIEDLKSFENVEIILFGDNPENVLQKIANKFVCHTIDRINDDEKLRSLYSLATVFVSPSLQESFGQVLTEAMSCETACIAFDYSGSKDILDHKKNGYLAKYKSVEDITNGLRYLLENPERLEKIKKQAREKVITKFDYDVVAKEYISLYSRLM